MKKFFCLDCHDSCEPDTLCIGIDEIDTVCTSCYQVDLLESQTGSQLGICPAGITLLNNVKFFLVPISFLFDFTNSENTRLVSLDDPDNDLDLTLNIGKTLNQLAR
jgi:hypothetical protein